MKVDFGLWELLSMSLAIIHYHQIGNQSPIVSLKDSQLVDAAYESGARYSPNFCRCSSTFKRVNH